MPEVGGALRGDHVMPEVGGAHSALRGGHVTLPLTQIHGAEAELLRTTTLNHVHLHLNLEASRLLPLAIRYSDKH